uniref:Putative dynein light chain n=1 Tax=Trypanosoma congolense (strain IL3000) TaxID=1068625 RepID=G0UYA0_TRYCI|nr:putative dynein light chain [Trypanosoma congolense IL3000]
MSDATVPEVPAEGEARASSGGPAVDNAPAVGHAAEGAQPSAATEVSESPTVAPVALSLPQENGHFEHDMEDGEEGGGCSSAAENTMEISGVPSSDVKNIILQVLSPYLDDEGGEDDAQRYDHIRAHGWIQLICDGIMEKLLAMRRPYKYVVHCVIMRKSGAGIHLCSSCYYGQADGWVNHAHDLSAHVYAVVSVYWSLI